MNYLFIWTLMYWQAWFRPFAANDPHYIPSNELGCATPITTSGRDEKRAQSNSLYVVPPERA